MQRMEAKELLNYHGGGIFTVISNLLVSIISLTKAIFSLKNLRG